MRRCDASLPAEIRICGLRGDMTTEEFYSVVSQLCGYEPGDLVLGPARNSATLPSHRRTRAGSKVLEI